MKPVSEMTKNFDTMKVHTAVINKIEKDLSERIKSIEDEPRSPEKIKEKIKQARDEASNKTFAELAKMNELYNALMRERPWYADSEFLLSTLPLENKFLLIAEAEKMSTSLLAMHIHHANENGEAAKLHVLSQEMNRRDPKPDGWKGVDFSKINLPIQKEALTLLSSAQAAFDEAVLTTRKINGIATPESIAISKLAAGHASGGE